MTVCLCFDGLRRLGENAFDFATLARELQMNQCVEMLGIRGIPCWFAQVTDVACVVGIVMNAENVRVLMRAFDVNSSVRHLEYWREFRAT